MAFAHDDQRFVPILQREHGDGACDVRRRHLPLWVKPANPDILPGLQTCEVIRNTHVSSEFESSLLLCQSGTGGGTAANIKCYRQCIFNPGADAILPQPSSLKAKFYNSFGARNWVNEIPACGWKMHRRQHVGSYSPYPAARKVAI